MTDWNAALSNQRYLQALASELTPALSSEGRTADGWASWRAALRTKLWELLGGPGQAAALNAEVVDAQPEDGYHRSLVRYWTEPGVAASAWLLEPTGLPAGRRVPAVLCLHGHGRGKDDVVGYVAEGSDPALADRLAAHQYDYARQLVRKGYIVLAPDARGFGERAAGSERGCYNPDAIALYLGRPITGQRLWDDMRALDYLQTIPAVDPSRLACVGLSEGGKRTLYLAALDDRVRVAVVSGYFCSLKAAIGNWDVLNGWDLCNQVPGLLRWADLPDIAALIVPRPLLFENGRADPLYPLDGVLDAFAHVQGAYEVLGSRDRVAMDLFDGGHRWSGRLAYDWLARWL